VLRFSHPPRAPPTRTPPPRTSPPSFVVVHFHDDLLLFFRVSPSSFAISRPRPSSNRSIDRSIQPAQHENENESTPRRAFDFTPSARSLAATTLALED
jgi:hypothetical protein